MVSSKCFIDNANIGLADHWKTCAAYIAAWKASGQMSSLRLTLKFYRSNSMSAAPTVSTQARGNVFETAWHAVQLWGIHNIQTKKLTTRFGAKPPELLEPEGWRSRATYFSIEMVSFKENPSGKNLRNKVASRQLQIPSYGEHLAAHRHLSSKSRNLQDTTTPSTCTIHNGPPTYSISHLQHNHDLINSRSCCIPDYQRLIFRQVQSPSFKKTA